MVVITVTPASHDFGQTLVGSSRAMQFTASSTVGDSMVVGIIGPQAAAFTADKSFLKCADAQGIPTLNCPLVVTFSPASVGIKTATLVVTNGTGQRANVPLQGEGVAPVGGARTKVTYTVEFSTDGSLDKTFCVGSGTDVLSGTLVGYEPPLPTEDNEYVGTLRRTTRMTSCDMRRTAAGTDVACTINYIGSGLADVKFTLYAQERGGYLEYVPDRAEFAGLWPPRPGGQSTSVVTGNCDPAEQAQLQSEYDEGQTAGSPNGQPLEVRALWPGSLPMSFSANPPLSIWTMRVIDRRP
jgi:hypothetical protein